MAGKKAVTNNQVVAHTSAKLSSPIEVIIDTGRVNKQVALEERYGIDPDTNRIEGAQTRHPNRHSDQQVKVAGEGTRVRARSGRNASTIRRTSSITPEIFTQSRETVDKLLTHSGNPCVSIYFAWPSRSSAANQTSDSITFKNILQQAQRTAKDVDVNSLEQVLAPAYQWLRDDFGKSQEGRGVAMFLSDGYFKCVFLAEAPDNKVVVNTSFAVAPLLPGYFKHEQFYLLVISKKQSKLFRGDKAGLTFVSIPEMPNGIEDVVRLEEKDDDNLIRSGSGGGGAVYHGTGSSRPDDKDNIAMYLAEVDSTIRTAVLRDATTPLVLAGVGYLVSIYKRVSHYNHIWETSITGSHEFENESVLFRSAMDALGDYFDQSKKKALTEYGNKVSSDLVSHILDDVVRAAYHKRIDTLFVDKRARLYGTFDDLNDELIVHAAERIDDDDLIDKTISKTLLAGGKVFMLDGNEMPVRRMMAAVMRYAH